MLLFALLSTFLAAVLSAETRHFAIDTTESIRSENIKCLKSQNYEAVGVRIFNDGEGDARGVQNIGEIINQLEVRLYAVPSVGAGKSAARQVSDMVAFGKARNWIYHKLFLQVTDPSRWSNSKSDNVALINDFMEAAAQQNISVHIFTNWYDYQTITGNANLKRIAGLWYWNTLGVGPNAETLPSFNDFRPFGPFKKPLVKLYGLQEKACGLTVNKSVYFISKTKLALEPSVSKL